MTTLDGGERIVTERVRSVRSVALGIWIGAGSRDETAERAGISHFIEHLLFKGSSRYSGVQIAQVFDGLGGELNAATAKEYTVLYARVLDAHLETALDVMSDMLLAPTFDADELNSEREVVLEEIAMYEDSFHDLAHDLIAGAVFSDHPLGRPVIGTTEAVNAIDTAMVRDYHANRYVGPNIVIAAAGNLEHEPLVHAIQQRFEAYTKVPDPSAGVRPVWVGESSPQTVFQAKASEQYHVCLAGLGLQRSDRRRFAASLLDSMLGGSASSRLFQEIRERRGMAYSVYTFGSQYADTGMVGVYVGTREDNLAECMRITADQLRADGAGGVRRRRAAALQGEPEGADHAVDGVHLEPGQPAGQVGADRHRAAVARPHLRRDRLGRAGGGGLAGPPAVRTRPPVGVRRGAGRGPLPRGRGRAEPRARLTSTISR